MRCTQKDMRERLGFTRDQLRLYEKRGIIEPEVNPNNRYRYYDDWQVDLLWDCRYYQAMGFSLAEIAEITQADDLEELEGRIDRRVSALEHDLRYRELVLEESRRNLDMLRESKSLLGSFRLGRHEGCVFVPLRRGHELIVEPGSGATAFCESYAGVTVPYFWYPRANEGSYYWGFAIRTTVCDELGEGLDEDVLTRIAPRQALVTCVDAGQRGGFGRELFVDLFEEAARRGLEPAGGIQGVLLARVHEEDGYHRYLRAFLPVQA